MRRALFPLFAVLALAGCKTVGDPATPAQKLYAVAGSYDAALIGANAYARQPGADATVIHTMNEAQRHAKPAVDAARAYPICAGGAVTATVGGEVRPCVSFDFSTAGILADVAALQAAIITLQGGR
jgi:hypothetical protein